MFIKYFGVYLSYFIFKLNTFIMKQKLIAEVTYKRIFDIYFR